MHHHHLVLDIETAPADDSVLEYIQPEFSAPANYKDANTIKKYVTEAAESWKEKAALDAISGRIVCIGLIDDGEFKVLSGDEKAMIQDLYALLNSIKEQSAGAFSVITFNGTLFDWPFILRRGLLLGVKYPAWLRRGRYFSEALVDIRDEWQLGDRGNSCGGLSGLAKAFGLGGKSRSGKGFHLLWESDRKAALDYVRTDLELTRDIGIRMGIIAPRNKEQDELPL